MKHERAGESALIDVHGGALANRAAAAASAPAPVSGVQLPAGVSAADHCSVLLAFHAAAISRNLECVFRSIDPEGPHQLRVALRRLRVVLRVFEPIIRKSAAAPLRAEARKVGAMVSELRDADVMIDEIIAPEARDQQRLLTALDAWRQEVRGRVRARLTASGADAFALSLGVAAAAYDWRKKNRDPQQPSAALLDDFLVKHWTRVAQAPIEDHSPLQVHDLRKDVKALRYAADMGGALGRKSYREAAQVLKRTQDALGYANDVETLRRFSPALVAERDAVSALCRRLVHERTGRVRANLVLAQSLLRELSESQTFVSRGVVVA